MQYSTLQSAGKGLKLHGRVWGPGGTCFAQVLKPSKCNILTWQGKGKGGKVHRRVSCPRVEPSKCKIRPGKALAKSKAARKGFGPWWNVLRAGFETF